jgi:hypothetical protein
MQKPDANNTNNADTKRWDSINRLQGAQDVSVTPEDRGQFLERLLSVKHDDIVNAPLPSPAKRGRPSKSISTPAEPSTRH